MFHLLKEDRMKTWSIRTCMALLFVAMASTAVAQTPSTPSTQQTQQQTLKPQMTVSDLVFTLNTLATVSINGSEVEAYIDVKNTFTKAYDQAQKDRKTENDVITVELSVLTANNFLQLFQRASLQGAAAEKFMAVKNALYASAPKVPTSNDTQIQNPASTGSKK